MASRPHGYGLTAEVRDKVRSSSKMLPNNFCYNLINLLIKSDNKISKTIMRVIIPASFVWCY